MKKQAPDRRFEVLDAKLKGAARKRKELLTLLSKRKTSTASVLIPAYVDPKLVKLMRNECECGEPKPCLFSLLPKVDYKTGKTTPEENPFICKKCGRDNTPRDRDEDYPEDDY